MATFIYKDGDTKQDIIITMDNVKRIDENSPWIGMDFSIETPDFAYHKPISIDDDELEDLLETFEQFINGEITDYQNWSHIEGNIEILFLPQEDQATLKISFGSFNTHFSGFFLDLFGKGEYLRFYTFIKETLEEVQEQNLIKS